MGKIEINQDQFKNLLKKKKNLLIYGNMGTGKTSIAIQYAQENELTPILYDLSQVLVEEIGGIPTIVEKDKWKYFIRAMDMTLEPMFKTLGKGYLLILDEINQAPQEIQNTLFSLCTPINEQRRWGEHPLPHLQVVAMGNLDDGSDGTVYLTPLPTPLENRFKVFQLKSDKNCVQKHLFNKFKQLDGAAKYIKCMLDNDITPRKIECVLETLQEEDDEENRLLISSDTSEAICLELMTIRKGLTPLDPQKVLKLVKEHYKTFKEVGCVTIGANVIYDEDEYIKIIKAEPFNLSDEEIESIKSEYKEVK